jgi:hypothetical protein
LIFFHFSKLFRYNRARFIDWPIIYTVAINQISNIPTETTLQTVKMRLPTRQLLATSAAPRAYLFTVVRANSRALSTTRCLQKDDMPPSFSMRAMPSPPRLPKEEQELFESLQRQSTGAFSTPISERRTPPQINQSPDSSSSEAADAQTVVQERVDKIASNTAEQDETTAKVKDLFDKTIRAKGDGEELHPNVRRGAQPEFEGDVNPKTGEVGGPKNEPLRWGPNSEWTYNGRATDF